MEAEKALVTGGAGFIGSNIVEKLVENNIEVTVLDNMFLGTPKNLEKVKDQIAIIEASVLNKEKLKEATENVDTIYHLAAKSSSPMHKENPVEGAKVNIEGFINTVEAAKNAETVEKIVYASTSSMYGSIEPPHKVDSGEYPMNLYTASKMSRELYAKIYSEQTDIQFTGLRFFSIYGPHEKGKGKYANVVTQFLWKMQKNEQPVIWGDGTQERDLTYVEDVVEAALKASKRTQKTNGETYNIGTGKPQTFNKVVQELNKQLNTNIEPKKIDNPRENYVEKHQADIQRTKEHLNWEPKHSFEQGLQKTVEYYT